MTRQSLVLLKNEPQLLPLKTSLHLAVIGPHMKAQRALLGNYFGQVCKDGRWTCLQTPLEAISNITSNVESAIGCHEATCASKDEFGAAKKIAAKAHVVVLFLGLDYSFENEGRDRDDLKFPGYQLELFQMIEKMKKPIVVVLLNGGTIGLEYLKASVWCHSIVEAFYPGVLGSRAIAELLFGHFNPSGKLPVTIYNSNWADQVDMASMDMTKAPGRTYRYFTGTPSYAFGWGLSYTSFKLTSNSSENIELDAGQSQQVVVHVKNIGRQSGHEVIQAYFRPIDVKINSKAVLLQRQLFRYQKHLIHAQESVEIKFSITIDAFTLVDNAGNRCVVPGTYELIFTNGVHETLTKKMIIRGDKPVIVEPYPQLPTENVAVE